MSQKRPRSPSPSSPSSKRAHVATEEENDDVALQEENDDVAIKEGALVAQLADLFPDLEVQMFREIAKETDYNLELAVERVIQRNEKENKGDKDEGTQEYKDEPAPHFPSRKSDSEIARELQAQFSAHVAAPSVPSLTKSDSEFARELQESENQANVRARPRQVVCLVCMEGFSIEDQFLGSNCFHDNDEAGAMCIGCATDFLKSEVNSSHFPIKCFVAKCAAEFSNSDLELVLNAEEMKRVERLQLQKVLASNQTYFPCLKPGCENGVFYDQDADFTRFTCPGCKSIWCVKCKAEFHDGETCERYQKWKKENGDNDNEMEKLISKGIVKRCPKCETPTQKNEGCNFLTCQRCHENWCWYCGDTHNRCHCGKNEHK